MCTLDPYSAGTAGLLQSIRRLLNAAVLLLMMCWAGCGTIYVTSDPPGAIVQRTAGYNDRSQISPEHIQYAGTTPCSFMASWQVEAVRVIWSDETQSEWQLTPWDWLGTQSHRLYFVKAR
jgi:hypothetical protein